MNVNMKLSKEELNSVFETLLKTALASNVTLNFNIDLDKVETPVILTKEEAKEILLEEPKTHVNGTKLTLARCLDCGCVQAVNTNHYTPTCYICGDELPTDERPYHDTCTCGQDIDIKILGKGVDYVSCHVCKKRYTIKLDFNQTKWVNKY